MISTEKVWVQAAIDIYDLELASQVAKMAVEAGADWVEAGTPLVYGQGLKGVDEMVKIADGRPVVVDYKAADGTHDSFAQAAKHGAAYAVVMAYADNGAIVEALTAGKETGIKVVADLMYVKNPVERALELEEMGIDAIFIHCGFDEANHTPGRKQSDGAREVVEAVNHVPVGIACDQLDVALEAVEAGVHWITFGLPILASPENFNECRHFIETIHNAR